VGAKEADRIAEKFFGRDGASTPSVSRALMKRVCKFSVSPVFSRASAGVRSRLAGIGGQKTNRKQARLRKFSFFESHIRATNAPARRSSILTIMLIMSKNTMLIALLRCAPVDSFAPAQLALRAAFGSLSLSVDSQDLPTRSSFGAALRQSMTCIVPDAAPFGPTFG